MKLAPIRVALVVVLPVVAGSSLHAQAPQAPNSVQVGVPQGSAQDEAANAARQQQARAATAKQPAPRTADGRIVLGNTKTVKGVWIGGNLGF